jgi:hypothetical protein
VLIQHGVEVDELAELCAVDPKTVGRWIAGRAPRSRYKFKIARRLGVNESYLWPDLEAGPGRAPGLSGSGFISAYPDRASVPREQWLSLLLSADEQIAVLVFSGTFFAQSNPQVARMLAERASAGVRVRLCFGDPDGHAVKIRGREEGIGDALAAKIRASLTYYRGLIDVPNCEIRLHDTTLYASLFRYDGDLLVNPHLWGQPASANPLMHLQDNGDEGWFEGYNRSFEAVWETARPWNLKTKEADPHG